MEMPQRNCFQHLRDDFGIVLKKAFQVHLARYEGICLEDQGMYSWMYPYQRVTPMGNPFARL